MVGTEEGCGPVATGCVQHGGRALQLHAAFALGEGLGGGRQRLCGDCEEENDGVG